MKHLSTVSIKALTLFFSWGTQAIDSVQSQVELVSSHDLCQCCRCRHCLSSRGVLLFTAARPSPSSFIIHRQSQAIFVAHLHQFIGRPKPSNASSLHSGSIHFALAQPTVSSSLSPGSENTTSQAPLFSDLGFQQVLPESLLCFFMSMSIISSSCSSS